MKIKFKKRTKTSDLLPQKKKKNLIPETSPGGHQDSSTKEVNFFHVGTWAGRCHYSEQMCDGDGEDGSRAVLALWREAELEMQ